MTPGSAARVDEGEHEIDPSGLARSAEIAWDVLQQQVRASEEADTKSRHLISLSAATVVVAVTVASLVAGEAAGWRVLPFAGLLTVTLILSFLASYKFAKAYVGTKKHDNDVTVGWEPGPIHEAAVQADSIHDVHLSSISGFRDWYRANETTLRASANLRKSGMKLLMSAGVVLGVAPIYIVCAISV